MKTPGSNPAPGADAVKPPAPPNPPAPRLVADGELPRNPSWLMSAFDQKDNRASFFSCVVDEYKRRKARDKDVAEKAAIAKAFNDRYTYRHRWDTTNQERLPGTDMGGITPVAGNAWMCPNCNRIHLAYECSVFDGLHYPSCCQYHDGNRLHENIKLTDR